MWCFSSFYSYLFLVEECLVCRDKAHDLGNTHLFPDSVRHYHRGEGTAMTRKFRWAQEAWHRQADGPLCGDGSWQLVHI